MFWIFGFLKCKIKYGFSPCVVVKPRQQLLVVRCSILFSKWAVFRLEEEDSSLDTRTLCSLLHKQPVSSLFHSDFCIIRHVCSWWSLRKPVVRPSDDWPLINLIWWFIWWDYGVLEGREGSIRIWAPFTWWLQ